MEAVRCLLKNNPSVTASLCHLPLYRGGNLSVRCGRQLLQTLL